MSLPSVAQLAQDLSARRISARELAEESLARAEKNQALNAFVTRCEKVVPATRVVWLK